jgi:hypothetical protein
MRQLRGLMQPIRTEGPSGRAVVGAFALDFSQLGRALGPVIDGTPTTVELSCVRIDKIRLDERSEPVALATLSGTLSLSAGGASFVLDGSPTQDASLTDVVEQDGHRRPRRKLLAKLPDGSELPLLLPDLMQVESAFMEVTAKLTVGGDVHADESLNEVLDVPLLPLSLTHAIFHFVDGNGEPLKQVAASFQSSTGETLQATTDDFGELYLDATAEQSYTLLEALPADDERVAVVETSLNSRDSAVA